MNTSFSIPVDKMIPITEARRNLGDLVDRLPKEKEFYLMRGGKIAAKLIAAEEAARIERKRILEVVAGAWERAGVGKDISKIILKRKSRTKPIRI